MKSANSPPLGAELTCLRLRCGRRTSTAWSIWQYQQLARPLVRPRRLRYKAAPGFNVRTSQGISKPSMPENDPGISFGFNVQLLQLLPRTRIRLSSSPGARPDLLGAVPPVRRAPTPGDSKAGMFLDFNAMAAEDYAAHPDSEDQPQSGWVRGPHPWLCRTKARGRAGAGAPMRENDPGMFYRISDLWREGSPTHEDSGRMVTARSGTKALRPRFAEPRAEGRASALSCGIRACTLDGSAQPKDLPKVAQR
jgi:hypothetical protein